MRGHRCVGGFQRAVKRLPHRLIGFAAQLVQFFPAFTQLVDGFGMALDGNLTGGGPGQCLRFGGELFAPLPAAPALPVVQAPLLAAQQFDAQGKRGIHRAAL